MSFIDNHLVPLAGRASAIAKDDPIGTAGRVSVAALVMMVGYNAAFAQVGTHAAPWFGEAEAAPELETTERAAPKSARTLADPVVFGLQSELMDLGFYEGTIDGIAGSRTRAAIEAYERAHSLPVTGIATEGLLARVRVEGVRHLPRPASRVAVVPPPSDEATGSIDPAPAPDTVRLVQEALAASGADIVADGLMGPNTRAAIEAWEEARGLPIVGEPSGALLAKLREAGL